MASSRRRTVSLQPDARELDAQRVACRYLVKGCERALFDFGLIAGETASSDAARIDERAADILRGILGSWRDTLSLLGEASAPRTAGRNAGGWMLMRAERSPDPAVRARLE